MSTNAQLASRWENLMIANYGTPKIAFTHGEGSYLFDVEGKKYLDLLGGIAVSVLGHSHPKIVDAIISQSKRLLHTSNLYLHSGELELAEKLISQFGSPAKVFICQDGATANEAALKLVRKYGYKLAPDGSKQVVISMVGGFHGRTSGALAITGNPSKRDGFGPFGVDVRFVEYNDVHALKTAMTDEVCAIFVETVQGEGGMNIASKEFLESCAELSKQHKALLVVDEVQSGVGRTGSFFNFNQHGISPDIVTLAKGLAGGLPIGALIATDFAASHFSPGDHGSTFGGNPLSVAAANAVVDEVSTSDFESAVRENSKWLAEQIARLNLDQVKQIRFSGLWFGIELKADFAAEVVERATTAGFLINAVKPNVLRLAPPLNISQSELQTFIDALPKLVRQ